MGERKLLLLQLWFQMKWNNSKMRPDVGGIQLREEPLLCRICISYHTLYLYCEFYTMYTGTVVSTAARSSTVITAIMIYFAIAALDLPHFCYCWPWNGFKRLEILFENSDLSYKHQEPRSDENAEIVSSLFVCLNNGLIMDSCTNSKVIVITIF